MSNRRRAGIATSALALALLGVAATGSDTPAAPPGPDAAIGAKIVPLDVKPVTRSYPVYDAKGRKRGTARWRVTTAGGNCCEVYIAATPKGKLVEFGGSYPTVSDDRGKTWYQVQPLAPLYNGEGAITAGPDGNIYGIGWDPYTGDHLQAYKYTADTKTWQYSESPLHTPVYDREWIGVAKGPFTILGQQYPIATVVMGGTATKEQMLISGDGLTYVAVSSQRADEISNGSTPVKKYLPVKPDKDLDWMQAHTDAGMTTLARGGFLMEPTDNGTCDLYRLKTDVSWECAGIPGMSRYGTLRQDSRGWLQEMRVAGSTVTLRTSTNGGRSWHEATAKVPNGAPISLADLKVNGKLHKTVVAAHTEKSSTGQDLVFVFDTRKATAKHTVTYLVGKGDLDTAPGVVNALGNRMDFSSVAILPDGKLAVSFDDSTTDAQPGQFPGATSAVRTNAKQPALAILL